MEKYKIKPISSLWYVVPLLIITWLIIATVKSWNAVAPLLLILIYAVCLILLFVIRKIRQTYANWKVRQVSSLLANVDSIAALGAAMHSFPKSKGDLKVYLQEMALEKFKEVGMTPKLINHVIANGRPCYYTGHVFLVSRKRKGDVFLYDFNSAKKVTFFIFPQHFELLTDNGNEIIGIQNIINTEWYSEDDLLVMTKRGKGGVICLHSKDVLLIRALILSLQH